jgi:hypothetical protein
VHVCRARYPGATMNADVKSPFPGSCCLAGDSFCVMSFLLCMCARQVNASRALAACFAALVTVGTVVAVPAVPDVVGSTHWAGCYALTSQPFLLEGAEALLAWGTRVIKVQVLKSVCLLAWR